MDLHASAFSGFKAYIRSLGKNRAELLAMATALADGIEDVTITSIGTEGTSSSGQIGQLPKEQKLAAIMEVYQEGNGGRQLGTFADFGTVTSPV
jgi:hypothetical protein